MCGIAGILKFDSTNTSFREIRKMTDVLAHRGPDGEGTYTNKAIGLGHRRLSIIDLEAGQQPMHFQNGNLTIVFNGEIYNYPTLRENLMKSGCQFGTHSDTEVILALYSEKGLNGFKELVGMFAFALWDERLQKLILCRDRSGMKPLYFHKSAQQFTFASEIKAIRAACPGIYKLDNSAINYYFSRQYIGGTSTVFEGVHKIKPGTCLEIYSDGSVSESVFWSLNTEPYPTSISSEVVEKTDDLLKQAVESHLISDVPVGIFLSGGIDSSTLLSYASGHSRFELQSFSVGFGGNNELNETAYAKRLAAHYGTQHYEIQVTEKETLEYLPHIISYMDQPIADYAVIPTYIMSLFAAQHVKVVLSGEGADELFGGYERYNAYALLDKLPFSSLFKSTIPPPQVFRTHKRRNLLSKEVFVENENLPQLKQMLDDKSTAHSGGHLNSMLATDMKNWLVDDLLIKVDNMGMLASLEARMPYLDHRLIDYVSRLNGKHKVTYSQKKILLKQIAEGRLPDYIIKRKKQGFTVPVGDWLQKALRPQFEEIVLSNKENQEWFDLKFIRQLFENHLQGKSHRLELWALFVFCLWKEQTLSTSPLKN
jgi:asparagine synthase (glutamine-hydrolysing)